MRFPVRLSLLSACILALCFSCAFAAPMENFPVTYGQPDGTEVTVFYTGSSYYAVARDAEGYPVTRGPDGYWRYAQAAPDGSEWRATPHRVGRTPPAGKGLRRDHDLSPEARAGIVRGLRERMGVDEKGRPRLPRAQDPLAAPAGEEGTLEEGEVQPGPPANQTLGQRVGLVLLAKFPDRPQDVTVSAAQVDRLFNDPAYTEFGNAASVFEYYNHQSNGRFQYNNIVTAYFTAKYPRDYYTDETVSYGTRARELLEEGLVVLKNSGFDFNLIDANGDKVADGINLMYAGPTVNAWARGLWPHKGGMSSDQVAPALNRSFAYQITNIGLSPTVGTPMHEIGHMIAGFADYYAYNSAPNVVGQWCLMSTGLSTGSYQHPAAISAYLKYKAGWADVETLTSSSNRRGALLVDRNYFYRFANPSKGTNYFVLENRNNQYGYEGPWGGHTGGASYSNPGLLVYQVLEGGSNANSTIPTSYTTPWELVPLRAETTSETWFNTAATGGEAFRPGRNTTLDNNSLPAAKFWSSSGMTVNSNFDLHSVGSPAEVITFVHGTLPATPAIGVTSPGISLPADYGVTPAAHKLAVFNEGGGTLSYSLSSNRSWIQIGTTSGAATNNANIHLITFDTSALPAGNQTGTITVTAGALTREIPVTIAVRPRPALGLSATAISGTVNRHTIAQNARSFVIRNDGSSHMAYTVSSNVPWILPGASAGTAFRERDLIELSFDGRNLTEGTHVGVVTVHAPQSAVTTQTVTVTLTVIDLPGPEIDVAGNGVSLVAGQTAVSQENHTYFGMTNATSGQVERTFVIRNLGTTNSLTGVAVTLTGTEFSLLTPPAATVLPGAETFFTVRFDPSSNGLKSSTVSIASNDTDENPFTFAVQGYGGTDIFPPDGLIPEGWTQTATSARPWTVVSTGAKEGMLSLRPGTILPGEKSEITVSGVYGAGTLTFHRRNLTTGNERLRFYINGQLMNTWATYSWDWFEQTYALPAGEHTFTWSYERDPDAVGTGIHLIDWVTLPPPPQLLPPSDFRAVSVTATSVELAWTNLTPEAEGLQIERRETHIPPPSVVNDAPALSGTWATLTTPAGFAGAGYASDQGAGKGVNSAVFDPGRVGRHSLDLGHLVQAGGADRIPVDIQHASGMQRVWISQSALPRPLLGWDFRGMADGLAITSATNEGSQSVTWSGNANGGSTLNGAYRLRTGSEGVTYAGNGQLGYTAGLYTIEVDLPGWNLVGNTTDQLFQLGFNTGNSNTVSCGVTLQQTATGFALFGRAIGTGSSDIGSSTTPLKLYPKQQNTPVTLRLAVDYTNNKYTVSWRDESTGGAFVTSAQGNLASDRKGGSLRLRVFGNWAETGEFIDVARIRVFQGAPDGATAWAWSPLGVFDLDENSLVTLGTAATYGVVSVDALRATPALEEQSWEPLAELGPAAESHSDDSVRSASRYEYRIRAWKGSVFGEWSPSLLIETPALPGSGFTAWQQSIAWNGSDNDASGDPDNDGLNNFAEYALGLNPLEADKSPNFHAGILWEDGQIYLTYTFTRNPSASDVGFHFLHGDSPAAWQTLLNFAPGTNPADDPDVTLLDDTEGRQTLRIHAPITEAQKYIGLRLESE